MTFLVATNPKKRLNPVNIAVRMMNRSILSIAVAAS
jgi:hypothetical protein